MSFKSTRIALCAIAAATWLSGARADASNLSNSNLKLDSEPRPRTAVVIGAGICGLSTAWFLRARGFNVTILERDRIGSPFQASCTMFVAINAYAILSDELRRHLFKKW